MPGTRRLLLIITAFAAAAGINTGSVALQQRTAWLTRRFGPNGWYVHLALVLPAWAGFLVLLPGLDQQVRWPLPRVLRPLGLPVLAVALALWLLAYHRLGGTRTTNGDQFGHGDTARVHGGIFDVVDNPMYVSYILAFLGLALRRANAAYGLLAAESYLLLNQVEARVENRRVIRPTTCPVSEDVRSSGTPTAPSKPHRAYGRR